MAEPQPEKTAESPFPITFTVGTAVTGVIALASHATGRAIPAAAFLAIAAGFGALSVIRIADHYRLSKTARNGVLVLWLVGLAMFAWFTLSGTGADRPAFEVELEQLAVGEVSRPDGRLEPRVVIQATIWNTGAPSAVRGLQLRANLGGEKGMIIGIPRTLPDRVVFPLPGGEGASIVFHGEDALNVKVESLIGRGSPVRGVMMYEFSNATIQELTAAFAAYEFYVTDPWGRRSVASSDAMEEARGRVLEAPQLHTEIIRAPQGREAK
jgi:hypothetical protein